MRSQKETLARGYSRAAARYDDLVGGSYLQGLRRLLPLIRSRPGMAVLDIGTGTGNNLFEVAARLGPCRLLCGIDISPGMIDRARQKAAALRVPVHFYVGDAERLPYPDGTFDLVIMGACYHWIEQRLRALQEVRRVLTPGGQFALITATHPCCAEWFLALQAVLGAPWAVSFPTWQQVFSELVQSGLVPIHFNPLLSRLPLGDPAAFARLMSAEAPQWAAEMDPAQQAAVELQVAALLAAHRVQAVTWAAVESISINSA